MSDHADELTTEPLFTKLLSKSALASQPTLSRFAHRLDNETINQLRNINQLLLDQYYQIGYPNHFIFDIDSTNFQAFGTQDGQAFKSHYSEMGYHPLLVFDGITKDCLKVELRQEMSIPLRMPFNFYSLFYPIIINNLRGNIELFEELVGLPHLKFMNCVKLIKISISFV